jgi:CRP/FNR family cyclic AMP-dependent transcriptional regulator
MPAPVEVIKAVPLFAGLSDREAAELARRFTERRFEAGTDLTSQGASGVGFFVLGSGEAMVTVDGEERRTLGPGDFFGELALLDRGSRTATITATTAGTAYGLTAWDFKPLIEANGAMAWTLLQELAHRIRELESRGPESI